MAAFQQAVDNFTDTWHSYLGPDDDDDEDYEPSDDEDDSDDEGRGNTSKQELQNLLAYLKEMDDARVTIVEALHCVNSWYLVEQLGVSAYHHGLVFKLSDDTFLRIHLVREGLAWRSYDQAPALPDSLVSSDKYKVRSRLAPMIPYCRDNAYWQWPNHDCEVFARGCLECIGVTMPNTADKIMNFINEMTSPEQPQPKPQQGLPSNNGYTQMAKVDAGPPKVKPGLTPQPPQPPDQSQPMGSISQSMPLSTDSRQPPPIERTTAKAEASKRVNAFLRENGFKGTVANGRRRCCIKQYPLHVAVKLDDAQMVTLLLHFGADPRKTNSWGKTPYRLACDLGNSEIEDILSAVTL